MAFDEAVAALMRYSLVEVAGDALSVHRLVQAVTRDRLTKKARQTWAEAAVEVVNGAFPGESRDVRTWPVCLRLLPHAMAAAGHAEQLELAPEAAGRVLNQVGVYLQGRARFGDAKNAMERSLAIGEAAYGANHPTVGIRVTNLGDVFGALGQLKEARACFQRALGINRTSLGKDHPRTVAVQRKLEGLPRPAPEASHGE